MSTSTRCAAELHALWRLARECGVTPSYENVKGERVRATPEAVLHAVRSFGIDVHSPAQAEKARRQLAAERAERFIEPVHVLWTRAGGDADSCRSATVQLQLLPEFAARKCECRLALEDGRERSWQVDLAGVPATAGKSGRVQKSLGLPGPFPIGYHQFEVQVGPRRLSAWLFVAPYRAAAFQTKGWGAFMPLYAVRSERNWGMGDFTDLRELSTWIDKQEGTFCGTLPLLALATNTAGFNPSPYTPTSRLFWNELYVDVESAPEFESNREAQTLVGSREFQDSIARLRTSSHVDYDGVLSLKRRVLGLMSEQFFAAAKSGRRAAMERAMARDPLLDEYAQFLAVQEQKGATWTAWPPPARGGRLASHDFNEKERQYHLYAQFLCAEQLSLAANTVDRGGCGLYLDLPVGVHPAGFDTWRYRDAFVHYASAGAPPDEFFTQGQNWGILPLHPQRTRDDGHAYFRQMIARHLHFASALRIDHVMWMHRMYWAPHGMPASEGVYVRYPADELYAVLCIESDRSGVPIVGENLGTVPVAVDRKMDQHGVHPLYVGQFALTGDPRSPFARPRPKAVASLNTHDTPTFAEHWFGGDIKRRIDLGLITAEQATEEKRGREQWRHSILDFVSRHGVRLRGAGGSDEIVSAIAVALLTELARSDVTVVLMSLEDLWAERRPQNVPGTHDDNNWRRKAMPTLEQVQRDSRIGAAIEKLRKVATCTT